ncbi:hypothetical protein [Nonomuraea jabiensis]|uniref:hypothetical protein n=1 Tax=Nonomuraea jabiensis TaxID=882448 RepID=UPI003D728DBF
MSHKATAGSALFAFVGLALVLGVGLVFGLVQQSTSRTETITVQDKDRVCDGGKDGTCRYLIFTDQGTYENTDTLFAGKFDSSNVQGRMKVGRTYEVEVRGWRIPFLSTYPNITQIEREVAK